MWDFSSSTRNRTTLKGEVPTTRPPGKSPKWNFKKKERERKKEREVPSSPVVRTWHTFTAVCAWFQYLVRELRSSKSHGKAKNKQTNKIFFKGKKKVEYSANSSEGRVLVYNLVSKFNSLEERSERRQWGKKSIFPPLLPHLFNKHFQYVFLWCAFCSILVKQTQVKHSFTASNSFRG